MTSAWAVRFLVSHPNLSRQIQDPDAVIQRIYCGHVHSAHVWLPCNLTPLRDYLLLPTSGETPKSNGPAGTDGLPVRQGERP